MKGPLTLLSKVIEVKSSHYPSLFDFKSTFLDFKNGKAYHNYLLTRQIAGGTHV
jgi:hypothetical protein